MIRSRLLPIAILAFYAALVLPTLGRQGVNWDEQTDLDVSAVYVSSTWGLVFGSADDVINVRLPMYAAGLVFRLIDGDPLWLARLLSVVVSMLTLGGVFVFCSLEFERIKALVAVALLAVSPYFLFFGKQALTEGDAWITAALVWLLVAAARYRAQPDLGRSAWVGVALGAALSAKISGLALIPPVLAWIVIAGSEGHVSHPSRSWSRPVGVASSAFLVWMVINAVVSAGFLSGSGPFARFSPTLALGRLGVGLLLALLVGRWIVRHRAARPPWPWQASIALVVAGLTFFLVPPVHTTNPRILGSLLYESFRTGSGVEVGFLLEAAVFHVQVVMIKSSLVLGLGLGVALAVAVARQRSRRQLRLPLWMAGSYFLFLVLLPWAQTRYMMPILPLLAICAADALVDLYRRRRSLAVALVTAATGVLAMDLVACYPDLNLNGYSLVGERYLTGRSTIGYRGIVHTPSDGIEQCLRWVRERATPADTVVTVFGERHITRAVLGQPPFAVASLLHDAVDLEAADWVVTALDYDIVPRQRDNEGSTVVRTYPHYDRRKLEHDFTRVYAVRRAFDLEVATVWRRTASRQSDQSPGRGR